jgi:transcriptional regulator with XRE-family HTH domain
MEANRTRQLLAANMRRLRKTHGLTQEELGNAAGVYQPLISEIENCAANPALDTLDRIAAALQVDPSELFVPLKGQGC